MVYVRMNRTQESGEFFKKQLLQLRV